ncbi:MULTISPECIES: Fur family transcriptional regulator [Alphaproteobacteria]|uniref:Fur family transcriptional regulator n=1 Tax=Alphaproteobacteria TaxID=28211 RepID=UPI003263212B
MKTLVDKCLEKGVRMTDARRIVIKVIQSSQDHPDAYIVHKRAKERDPTISFATIYRTLKLLEDMQLVNRHDFGDGRSRYEEMYKGHHDHLINLETGEIIEFQNEALEQLKRLIAERLGYDLRDHRLELYGIPIST